MNESTNESIDIKDTGFTVRIAQWMIDKWWIYAMSIGYNHLSEFIRDCVNGIIDSKMTPEKSISLKEKNKNGKSKI